MTESINEPTPEQESSRYLPMIPSIEEMAAKAGMTVEAFIARSKTFEEGKTFEGKSNRVVPDEPMFKRFLQPAEADEPFKLPVIPSPLLGEIHRMRQNRPAPVVTTEDKSIRLGKPIVPNDDDEIIDMVKNIRQR